MSIEQIIEDWKSVKRRWEAWWRCELYDRVLICITAPLAVPRSEIEPAANLIVDPETQWTDINYMIRRTLEGIRTTYYGGESIPFCWDPISVGHALYFDCKPHFSNSTVWVDAAPVGVDGYPILDCWRDNPWWQWMHEGTAKFAQACKGRYFVLPFWGNHAGDTLAVVRGPQSFYMDIALNPGWVKSAVKIVSDIQIELYEELSKLMSPEITGVEGSLNYVGCWSPTKTLAFDCDISYSISPEAFKELFLPPLIETMHTVDHRIYHLDGAGALHHLNTLLDIPELHAIQWVPGAGDAGGIMQWIPLIRRIQSKGKGIVVYVGAEEVEPLLKQVKHEGLCIVTSCRAEKEARKLIRIVNRFSSRK